MHFNIQKLACFAAFAILVLSSCSSPDIENKSTPTVGQPAEVIFSGSVSKNITPYDRVFQCLQKKIGSRRLSVAVGDVRDYTGKSSADEGMQVTQGGALMAYSALGKLQPSVQVHERFDTRIADAELSYIKERYLGDGSKHEVPEGDTGEKSLVPWMPYFGGSVLKSDYYIVGGITELNYNILSEGSEFQINQIGPKSRKYVLNVAVDLRIVGTQSLRVYKTASVQKQIVGYEVGFGIFRFFGNDLFDLNAGEKSQEPLQLGVRMAIEESVLQLISEVTHVDDSECRILARSDY